MKIHLTLPFAFILLFYVSHAQLFVADFEDDTVGSLPGAFNNNFVGSGNSANVVDSGSPFGSSGNQYVHMVDDSDNALSLRFQFAPALPDVFTLTFEFYEPLPVSGLAGQQTFMASFTDGSNLFGAGVGFGFDNGSTFLYDDGGLIKENESAYTEQTAYRVDMVVNASGSIVNYEGANTLAARSSDLWITNISTSVRTLVQDDGDFRFNPTELTYLNFFTFAGGAANTNHEDVDMYFDNVAVFDGASVGTAIPEPSTYGALVSLAALSLAGLRRMRKS